MSTPLNIERDEVSNVATIFDTTADTITNEGESVSQCTFDESMAGRKYTDSGTAIQDGFREIAVSLQEWQAQSHGIAQTMREAVAQYGQQDKGSAEHIAGQR